MNASTPSYQVEQHQTTRLNINFSHRLPDQFVDFDMSSPHELSDAVNQSTDRAAGILHMLADRFIGAIEDCRLSDGVMYHVIMAAIREIEDVNSIVNAFSDAAILKEIADVKQNEQNNQA
ncbi:hypothetical protein [Methylobacter psychrophilus]|uniref:hypothetical protein n=1 Tax=Methylobacter psychrophilus TaxID=96941 RepID=UPI0021D4C7F3|nr:hypothetical protein [Methylobacter psychrophilus]